MSVKMRKIVENEICTAVVDALLKAKFLIQVESGEPELVYSKDRAAILAAMFLADEDRLYVRKAGTKYDKDKACGWVRLVYGNDGWDVISDYTTNLEAFIGDGTPVEAVIQKYAD